MIDMTKSVAVTKSGLNILKQGDHPGQLFTHGRVLLVRKKNCIVLLHTGKKVDMPLVYPAIIDGVTYHVDIPEAEASTVPTVKVRLPKVDGETKISKCRALYAANSSLTREQMIALFVSAADCTPAGAVTYYLTCKKG